MRLLVYPSYSVVKALPGGLRRAAARDASSRDEVGGADRNRTDDIQLAKLALYQLSYSPIKSGGIVGTGGPRWI